MAFAWSLPTKFDTPLTYFYVIYFAVLLIHRQRRDDEMCAKKSVMFFLSHELRTDNGDRYGKDWEEYKKLVPYRIVPYVY
jgi:Delta14-sterol reductase